MTDKQIIIDGVDVSGCTHKKNDACMAITDLSGDFCHYCNDEIMKNCYYKQLKLKEQECERLMSTLTEIKEIAEVLITTTDEYDSCYYKDKCSKCEVKEDCQYIKVEQILQKISECEVE